MSSDMPDWLRDLSKGITNADEDMSMEPELEAEPEPELPAAPDPMADLRSQMGGDEFESVEAMPEPVRAAPRPRRRRGGSGNKRNALGLLPWQGFFLSVLLFFDIAFVGLLFLVMLQRIAIPVP